MIVVPESLQTEIKKLRGRQLEARCRFDFSDTSIDNTILGFSNGINHGSIYEQLYNGKEDVTHKWFSLDGSCKLDGTYHLAPETESGKEKYEIGWWSELLSNDSGEIKTHQGKAFNRKAFGTITLGRTINPPSAMVNFTPRQVSEINVAFDNARNEYAIDFDVNFYDINGALLDTYSITGNTGLKYNAAITPISAVSIMEVKVTKWSHSHRNIKIAEMFTMISIMINGRDIVSMQVIEDRELSNNSLPIGTTASGSCVLQFFNRNRLFDWNNTESRLYNFIRKGVKMIPEIGDGINWVPMGTYFVEEWDIPTEGIIVTATGLDLMAALDESEYTTSAAIEAPNDQNFLVDTAGEWSSATLNGTEVSGDTIRMVFQ